MISITDKVRKCVEIWVEKQSIPEGKFEKKYDEILEKVLSGVYKEGDLDKFIDGHMSGRYK